VKHEGKHAGLCATCRNASGCTFPRDSRRPVLLCDEYEPVASALKSDGCKGKPQSNAPICRPQLKDDDSWKRMGLCVNCEGRDTCTFPKPEGGVWHCEEYQ